MTAVNAFLEFVVRFNLWVIFASVAVSAALISSCVYWVNCIPIRFENFEDTNVAGDTGVFSELGDVKLAYRFKFVDGYPPWYRSNSSPPLSVESAIRIASKELKSLRPQLPNGEYDLAGIQLVPWYPQEGYWYWVIEYTVWSDTMMPGHALMGQSLRIVVLMDGSCPDVSISPLSNNLIE